MEGRRKAKQYKQMDKISKGRWETEKANNDAQRKKSKKRNFESRKKGKIQLNHSTDWHRATLCVNPTLIFTEQINPVQFKS